MKLYISDLDGTLLNSNKEISEYTRDVINALIAKGLHFSVATARTAVSTAQMLAGLHFNLPVVLMNGAVIYDIQKGKYIHIESIGSQTAHTIIDIMKEHGKAGFMYAISNQKLKTYYECLNTPALENFYQERVSQYQKSFVKTVDFHSEISADHNIVYFTFLDEHKHLQPMAEYLKTLSDIDMAFYEDIYHAGLWFLEIFSKRASKYNAVRYLRQRYQFDTVIGFGDNFNDIPLFEACDEGYAVGNAVRPLKEKATMVIGDNNSDGVARFITEREGLWTETVRAI